MKSPTNRGGASRWNLVNVVVCYLVIFVGWWSRQGLVHHPVGVVPALADQCQNQFPPWAPRGPRGVGCCRTGSCSTLLGCAPRPSPERGSGDTECADNCVFSRFGNVYVSLSAQPTRYTVSLVLSSLKK